MSPGPISLRLIPLLLPDTTGGGTIAIGERDRHRLYDRLEQILGPKEATILMAHLPPLGWADVATKRDLDALAEANRRDHEALAEANRRQHEAFEQRLTAAWHAGLCQETRAVIIALATSVVSVGGLAFAAARLT